MFRVCDGEPLDRRQGFQRMTWKISVYAQYVFHMRPRATKFDRHTSQPHMQKDIRDHAKAMVM